MAEKHDVLDLGITISAGNKYVFNTCTDPITIPAGAPVAPFGDRGIAWSDKYDNQTIIVDCRRATINGVTYERFVAGLRTSD